MAAKHDLIIANKIFYYQEEPFKSKCFPAPQLPLEEHIYLSEQSSEEWYKVKENIKEQDNIIYLEKLSVYE